MKDALEVLMTRRSCRKYKPDPVKEEDLTAILAAGTYAPTGMGKQSPIIVVVRDGETIRKIEKMNAAVRGDASVRTFYGAPVLIVVFGQTDVPFGVSDGNLVIGNLLNAAHAVGVDSCYIWRAREVFESEEGRAFKADWNIPDNYEGVGNVILGYGEEGGTTPAKPRKEDYIRFV